MCAIDDLLRHQARRMQERLRDAQGAGLAATQVGILRRLFVYRETPEQTVAVMINPRILAQSGERDTFLEGCLSFNTVIVAVERSVRVSVEAADLDGRRRVREFEGFAASLMQHEIDHLDGILTLDRALPDERRQATRLLLEQARADRLVAA